MEQLIKANLEVINMMVMVELHSQMVISTKASGLMENMKVKDNSYVPKEKLNKAFGKMES